MGCPEDQAEAPQPPRQTSSLAIRLLAIFALSALALNALLPSGNNPVQVPIHKIIKPHMSYDSAPTTHIDDEQPFKPTLRYDLSTSKAACWPSTGGVWIKSVTAVELDFLGVARLNSVERSTDSAEENKFCTQLRKIGASWYSLPPRWEYPITWCEEMDDCVAPDTKVQLVLGYEEKGTGVWVLDVSDGMQQFEPGIWALQNALNMTERCEVIKKVGGKFCADMTACEETRKLID